MPTEVKFRRGTTLQNDAFTGAAGELSVDTQKGTIRVHDGSTQGGFELVNQGTLIGNLDSALGDDSLVAKIRGFFSASGDLSYDSATGQFSFDVEQVYTKSNFDSDFNTSLDEASLGGTGLVYNSNTNTLSIADTGVIVGTYGSATTTPVFTVNARGQIDSIGSVQSTLRTFGQTLLDSTGVYVVDTFSASSFRSGVYNLQISSLVGYQALEYRVLHDNYNVTKRVTRFNEEPINLLDSLPNGMMTQFEVGEWDCILIDSSDTVQLRFNNYQPGTYINYERLLFPNPGNTYYFRIDLDSDTENDFDLSLNRGRVDLSKDLAASA